MCTDTRWICPRPLPLPPPNSGRGLTCGEIAAELDPHCPHPPLSPNRFPRCAGAREAAPVATLLLSPAHGGKAGIGGARRGDLKFLRLLPQETPLSQNWERGWG